MMRKWGGFSLIEIMIVVVIIGIIASIGYPAYQNYVREARRTDAYTTLTDIAAKLERHFNDNNVYVTGLTALGYSSATPTSPEGYYVVTATAGPTATISTSYTLTAAAQSPQTSDTGCTSIVLNSAGSKTPATCW